jgi:diguanylate cyclase (GGDEF)-like protein/putative nucleotidyltransferase with HDIG domain
MYLAGLIYFLVSPEKQLFSLIGVSSILLAMGTFTLVNHMMIAVVIWLARGENFSESGLFEFFSLMLDFTLLCMGAATAYIWELTPFGVVLILLPLYLIYTTLKVPALERKTEKDPKTGLYNAEYFQNILDNEIERANRFNRPLTVVMADLDLLRNINNAYGHLAGDQVLIGVANIFRESVRDFDVVSRFGGEEYAIMMPETTPQEAYPLVEAMRDAIEEADFIVQTSITPIKATMSFGIADRCNEARDAKSIIHNADTALYHVKLKGRNGTFIYSDEGIIDLFNTQGKSKPLDENETQLVSANSLEANPMHTQNVEIPALNDIYNELTSLENEQQISDSTNDKIKIKPHPRWAVPGLIFSMTMLAIGLWALLFRPVPGVDWIGLSAFILLVILTEWFSIDIYARNSAISTSAVPILAGTLIYGPLGALLLSFTFATVAMIKHRSPPSRFLFNFSNQMIAGLTYTVLLTLAGVSFMALPAFSQFLVCLVAIGIVYIVTTGLLAMGMGFDRGASVGGLWKERFSWLLPYYIGMGVIAYVLIFSFTSSGPTGTLIFIVPLLLLRLSQKQYIDRTKAYVKELKTKNLELEISSDEISKLNEGLLHTLAEVVDLRDPYVLGHSKQVANYALMIAERLGLSQNKLDLIHKAALLHDIGKLGISESILFKPGKLTKDEYDIVKNHVTLGADILAASHALKDLIPIIRHHHERFDGLGYPDGLEGENIPVEARILSVADAVEAMASDRPYRRGLSNQEAIEELEKCSSTQFDPLVVKVFIEILQNEKEAVVINSARSPDKHELQPAHVLLGSSSTTD